MCDRTQSVKTVTGKRALWPEVVEARLDWARPDSGRLEVVAEVTQTVALGEQAAIFDVMSTMRAMRRLRPDPVPDELLDRLVQTATWAPSGSNLQA